MADEDLRLLNLPSDVIFNILSRLPTKALIQFRCVSRLCLKFISDPAFIKHHLSQRISAPNSTPAADDHHLLLYYESDDYTDVHYSLRSPTSLVQTLKLKVPFKSVHGYSRIVGSSRGVICVFDTNYFNYIGRVIFWNPSIKKLKFVANPVLTCPLSDHFSHIIVGFGFVSTTVDFKAVQILYKLDEKSSHDVLVYSLKDNMWRKIETLAPCFIPKTWFGNVFVKGFVNWLAFKKPKVNPVFDCIMAFDMLNEEFRVIEFPGGLSPGYDRACLASSNCEDLLFLCFHYTQLDGDKWDVWVMKEYGVADSWKKSCGVVHPLIPMPPLFIKGDLECLIVINNGDLVLYDVDKGEIKDFAVHGLATSFCMVNYISSLALLDG